MTKAPEREREPLIELLPARPRAQRQLPPLAELLERPDEAPTRPGAWARARERARAWVASHRRSLVVVACLLVVVGVVHGVGMNRTPLPVDDEGTYMAQAWSVQVRHALTPYTYWYDHPPLGWVVLSGWTFVTHAFAGATLAIVAGRHIMLGYALADAALLYVVARRLDLSRVWSSVAVLAYGLSPLAVDLQRMVYLDNLAMPWVLGAFALALTPRRRLWTFAASGACFAVAVLSKETMLLFAPALVYQVWQRSDRSTRAFCVTATAAVATLLIAVYPLLALLKGELVPGPGHVSLASAVTFQLGGRQGSGNPLDPTSQAHTLVTGWLHLDPWLLGAGVLCLPVGIAVRRFRPVALAQAVLLLDVVHGGYIPVPYVIALLPFAALLAAAAGASLQGVVARVRARGRRAALSAGLVLAAAGVVAAGVAPAWAAGLHTQMTDDQMRPTAQAESWLERHVPRSQRLLTDDTMWVDLVDHGFDRPFGVVWFSKLGYVNNLDPSVARVLPQGWRDFRYVVVTPSMREALGVSGGLPQVAQAVSHSVPVATFGSGIDTIVIRRISPQATTRPTAAPEGRSTT